MQDPDSSISYSAVGLPLLQYLAIPEVFAGIRRVFAPHHAVSMLHRVHSEASLRVLVATVPPDSYKHEIHSFGFKSLRPQGMAF